MSELQFVQVRPIWLRYYEILVEICRVTEKIEQINESNLFGELYE